jgi:rsbT co-antagonist protein RsbR
MNLIVFLLRMALIMFEVLLAGYVGIRAGRTRPARMFVLATMTMVVINCLIMGRLTAETAWEYKLISAINWILQGVFLCTLAAMLAALFVPRWWERRRPIIWIMLPYVLTAALVGLDLLLKLGIFVSELRLVDGEVKPTLTPGGQILMGWYLLGTVVLVVILVVSFIRVRNSRRVIGGLALALGLTLAILAINSVLPIPAPLYSLIITLPLLGGLAYAALSSDLLIPVRLASDMALRAMRDAVVVIGDDGLVLFCNPAATALGVIERRPISATMVEEGILAAEMKVIAQLISAGQPARHTIQIHGHQMELLISPITGQGGRQRGALILGRDITEVIEHSAQLENERARLATTVQVLETRERERDELAATVRAQALPVIPILEGVLVLPLVGEFDSARATDLTAVLLRAIEQEQARQILLDVTGVPLLDTQSAAALIQATQAATLLGARCTLVGIRPEIAQTLVSLGVTFGELTTVATLQQGLQRALATNRNE